MSSSPPAGSAGVVLDYFTDSVAGLNPKQIEKRTVLMGIASNGPLIERDYQKALPYQFDREVARNSFEAGSPQVEIGPDWIHVGECVSAGAPPTYRYVAADIGRGMTGVELVHFFNMLSSSGKSFDSEGGTNFGMGAKLSLLAWNPDGLVVMSWVGGVGTMIKIVKRPGDNNYGLWLWEELDDSGASTGNVVQFTDAPEIYKDDYLKRMWREHLGREPEDHEISGTIVVAMGKAGADDTILGPEYPNEKPGNKVHTLACNRRFFEVPSSSELRVFEFNSPDKAQWPSKRVSSVPQGGMYRRVEGAKYFLDKYSQPGNRGTVVITDAKVHWWVLDEERDDIHSIALNRSFVAALFDNELYNVAEGGDARSRYQNFGVLYPKAQERVVLIVEAEPWKAGKVAGVRPDSARSLLHMVGSPELPWRDWGAEFVGQMPQPIREINIAPIMPLGLKLQDRLKKYISRIRSPQFRRSLNGIFSIIPTTPGGKRKVSGKPKGPGTGKPGGSSTGKAGNGGSQLPLPTPPPDGAVPANKVNPKTDYPYPEWVYIKEETRVAGDDLEGKAARYVENSNKVQINGDFPYFQELIDFYVAKLGGTPGAEQIITQTVKETIATDLAAKIIHTKTLEGTTPWANPDDVRKLRSNEALTLAVLGVVAMDAQIEPRIGGALGAASKAKAS